MSTKTENEQAHSPLADGSVIFEGHINRHPMHKAIYDLCGEIEKLPASEQQTKIVVAAGELQHGIAQLRAEAAKAAKCLRQQAADGFPESPNGQKHFARIVMESVAEELDDAFNPQNASGEQHRGEY
jgi:hypothetical protein